MRNVSRAAIVGFLFLASSASWAQGADSEAVLPPVTGEAACAEGRALAQGGHHTLAYLYLQRCHRRTPTPEIRDLMQKSRRALRNKVESAAPISLVFTPSHATARLFGKSLPTSYKGVPLLNEDELWLAEGHYEIEVEAGGFEGGRFAIDVESNDRMLIPIRLRNIPKVGTTEVDMSADPGSELGQVARTADPRPRKFKSLLAKRYQRAPTPTPIPVVPRKEGRGPRPYITTCLATVAIGTGVVMHARHEGKLALAGYGSGALLAGLAIFLFQSGPPREPSPIVLNAGQGEATLMWQGAW
ncbi:MAG: hypothetical protein GY811_27775 [Myxococcales bacterium]|nr:hypothetical protein [Myxococcales bacterium]